MCTTAVLLALTFAVAPLIGDKPVLELWPQGLPADAKPVAPERIAELEAKQDGEHLTYVATPSLSIYRADPETANGCCVVVCPGGGYNVLAWRKEGLELAEWFNSIGVTAVVLKYRVPRRDPERPHQEPLQDVQRAVRLVRHNAESWGVDPTRIGVLGFSAGGHLTFMAGTHFDEKTYEPVDAADELSARPDFLCPIYAAYLGEDYRDDVAELGSLVRITERTPPTFMAVTLDDKCRGAQAGLLLAEYQRSGVPAEAHVYSVGGHGYGIRPSDRPVATWHLRLADWMRVSGLLEKRERD